MKPYMPLNWVNIGKFQNAFMCYNVLLLCCYAIVMCSYGLLSVDAVAMCCFAVCGCEL